MEEKESIAKVKKSSGSYRFRVEGYSSLSTKVGDSIESPEFHLCGHDWQLRIFPGGSLESHRGFVSFYLASKSTKVARASYKLLIKSQVTGGVDEMFASSGIRTFEAKGVQVDGWGRDKFMSLATLMDVNNGFFVDDSVIFKVEITVVGDLESVNCPNVYSIDSEAKCSLQYCLSTLLNEGDLGDVLISTESERFAAHKCILCARSPVFRAMFKTCKMQESVTGEVFISDIEPVILKNLLHYMYTDELIEKNILEEKSVPLLLAASKYQIKGLMTLCEDFIAPKLDAANIIPTLTVADACGAYNLKEKCFQFIGQNFQTIMQTKEFQLLEGDLSKEVQFVIELANRRRGCRGILESEKRFANVCTIM